jgi:uncharacterized integral membrane protein
MPSLNPMNRMESAIHWRPWSVAVVLALFIALFALKQFSLLEWSFSIELGCAVLLASAGWNVYVLFLARARKNAGMHGAVADGLLLAGLLLVFVGAFF